MGAVEATALSISGRWRMLRLKVVAFNAIVVRAFHFRARSPEAAFASVDLH